MLVAIQTTKKKMIMMYITQNVLINLFIVVDIVSSKGCINYLCSFRRQASVYNKTRQRPTNVMMKLRYGNAFNRMLIDV